MTDTPELPHHSNLGKANTVDRGDSVTSNVTNIEALQATLIQVQPEQNITDHSQAASPIIPMEVEYSYSPQHFTLDSQVADLQLFSLADQLETLPPYDWLGEDISSNQPVPSTSIEQDMLEDLESLIASEASDDEIIRGLFSPCNDPAKAKSTTSNSFDGTNIKMDPYISGSVQYFIYMCLLYTFY